MNTAITTSLANCLHADRLRDAERARLAASARASRRGARRAFPAATPASRIIGAIFLRAAA